MPTGIGQDVTAEVADGGAREAFGVAVRGLITYRRFTAMLQQQEPRSLALADI